VPCEDRTCAARRPSGRAGLWGVQIQCLSTAKVSCARGKVRATADFVLPYIVLLLVSVAFGLLAWKEAVAQTADSYSRASAFVQRKRSELAWQLPVLGVAQTVFVVAVFCLAQLLSWLADAEDGYVHKSTTFYQWAEIAVSLDQISVTTKSVVS
jgi:hypothetical protein